MVLMSCGFYCLLTHPHEQHLYYLPSSSIASHRLHVQLQQQQQQILSSQEHVAQPQRDIDKRLQQQQVQLPPRSQSSELLLQSESQLLASTNNENEPNSIPLKDLRNIERQEHQDKRKQQRQQQQQQREIGNLVDEAATTGGDDNDSDDVSDDGSNDLMIGTDIIVCTDDDVLQSASVTYTGQDKQLHGDHNSRPALSIKSPKDVLALDGSGDVSDSATISYSTAASHRASNSTTVNNLNNSSVLNSSIIDAIDPEDLSKTDKGSRRFRDSGSWLDQLWPSR